MESLSFATFESVFQYFMRFVLSKTSPDILQEEKDFSGDEITFKDQALSLICAFNRILSGTSHPQYEHARQYLRNPGVSGPLQNLAQFLRKGLAEIRREIEKTLKHDVAFANRLSETYRQLVKSENELNTTQSIELFWQVFFPEGTGILQNKSLAEDRLRRKRTVRITAKSQQTIRNPAAEILFTSNVLLTVPLKSWDIDRLPISEHIKQVLKENKDQPQQYWYDHPVPLGIAAQKNEVLYGLRGLNEMMDFEKKRKTVAPQQKLTVVLSCSVTHPFLGTIAKEYLQDTIRQAGGFEHLRVFLFTEKDVRQLVQTVLLPAARFGKTDERDSLQWQAVGVDGPYGKHYSFLKAIAAFWQVVIDPEIKATFKIDLDQVFDETHLLAETGLTALQHFKSDLWGADGLDDARNSLHLGMIAGALVNAADIRKSLFTPDVLYPGEPQHADEFVFFSRLPQALSTQAEMMCKYGSPELDGSTSCLQRVHVTGGTNGILIKALRRFRPFTPSFIGRAEDQAYLLSTMTSNQQPLAYLHKAGLIMRHDKELFAREAINAAEIGKLIGDYERILYFSTYARALDNDYRKIKDRVDPFTGCFISSIPKTIVLLRFTFKLLDFLQRDQLQEAKEFMDIGIPRLTRAMDFCEGENSLLQNQYETERAEWNAYYGALEWLEKGSVERDTLAIRLKRQASRLVRNLQIV